MKQSHAVVLRQIDKNHHKILLLHQEYGKIVVYTRTQSIPVCVGAMLVCVVQEKKGSFVLRSHEQVALPTLYTQEQLYTFHILLQLIDAVIPIQGTVHELFESLLYFYTHAATLTESQYQFFSLYICLLAGVFPEDPHLYTFVLAQSGQSHALSFSVDQEKKIQQAFAWCWDCINEKNFLYLKK